MFQALIVTCVIWLIIVLMAKKRKSGRFIAGRINQTLALGALANNDVIKQDFDEASDVDLFTLSMDLTWTQRDCTVGEGPIYVGVAASDYTDAEIEEALEAQDSWDIGDLVVQEHARRKVRIIGAFPILAANEVLNDGKPIRTKLRMRLPPGKTLCMFGFNKSGHDPTTTGGQITVEGRLYAKLV